MSAQIKADQLPIESNSKVAVWDIEQADGCSTQVTLDKATHRFSIEVVTFDDDADEWNGEAISKAEFDSRGYTLPDQLVE